MEKNTDSNQKRKDRKKILIIFPFFALVVFLLVFFLYFNKEKPIIEDNNNDNNQTQDVEHDKEDDIDIDTDDDVFETEKYSIVFIDDNGSVLRRFSLEYGMFPRYPNKMSEKIIDGYLYTFVGWFPALHEVTGPQIYTATYKQEWVGSGGGGGGGSSDPVSTDAVVTYYNNLGTKTTIKIPSGTEIFFNEGDHGTFSTQPESVILTDRQALDITVDPYVPTPEQYYTYKGYEYNNVSNTFTAVYAVETHNVTFNMQGHGIQPSNITLSSGQILDVSDTAYKPVANDTYVFNGFKYNNKTFTAQYSTSSPSSTAITYLNTNGYPSTVKLAANTEVKFNAGDHGVFASNLFNITLGANQKIDTRTQYYTPVVTDDGYKFIGYTYNSSTKTFTAKYEALPVKGTIIKLSDGHDYRVLKYNGSNAFVLYMDNDLKSIFHNVSTSAYKDSDLDSAMTTWYNGLSANAPIMQVAIKLTEDIKQHTYKDKIVFSQGDFPEDYVAYYESGYPTFGHVIYEDSDPVTIGDRYVYALGLEDITEYIADIYNQYGGNVANMFFKEGTQGSQFIWLSSASDQGTPYVAHNTGTPNVTYIVTSPTEELMRPAFYIDLSYPGVFDEPYSSIQPVIYNDADGNLQNVSVSNPISFNKGTNGKYDTTPATQSIEYNTKATRPTDPVAYDYTFGGWYKEEECSNAWNFETDVVTEDTELFAKWTANTYTVSISKNGNGNVSTSSVANVPSDSKITIVDNKLIINGTQIVATPSEGQGELAFAFDKWIIDGNELTYDYPIREDSTIVANFVQRTKPTVTYEDASGTLRTKTFNNVTVIHISAGSNGVFDPPISGTATVFPNMNLDLTLEPYIPKANEDYLFNGYEYDDTTKTFTAQYRADYPIKGDIITLPDTKKYRVLSIDDSDALVMYMGDDITHEYDDDTTNTGSFGDTTGILYSGSTLDTYLNTTWYEALNTGSTISMHDAIKDVDLKQNIYKLNEGEPDYNDYVSKGTYINGPSTQKYYMSGGNNPATVGPRKVYALSLEDVVDYIGRDNFSKIAVQQMLFNTTSVSGDKHIWLSSASSEDSTKARLIDGSTGDISSEAVTETGIIRPVFTIDLSAVTYSVENKYSNVKYINSKREQETVAVPINSTVKFNATTLGHYSTYLPDVQLTEHRSLLNLSADKYKPTAVSGYKYDCCYRFDYDTNTFMPLYKELPIKGDIITLNDGHNYRVLKTDGAKAFVVYMDNDLNSKYSEVLTTTYKDSTLDNKMKDWYNTTLANNAPEMKAAIQLTENLQQHCYSYSVTFIFGEIPADCAACFYVGNDVIGMYGYLMEAGTTPPTIGDRYVYALDLKDITDYIADEYNYCDGKVTDMLGGSTIWLSSSSDNNAVWCVANNTTVISSQPSQAEFTMRPAFYIDLLYDGVYYDYNSQWYGNVIYENVVGIEYNKQIKSFNVPISISSGDHGHFEQDIEEHQLRRHEIIDLRTPQYTPIADSGYTFIGYEYSYDSSSNKHKFVAKYDEE